MEIIKDILHNYLNAESEDYKRTLLNTFDFIMDSLKKKQKEAVLKDREISDLLSKINKRA